MTLYDSRRIRLLTIIFAVSANGGVARQLTTDPGEAGTASDSGGKVSGENTRVLGRPNAQRARVVQTGTLLPIEDLIVPERAAKVPPGRFYAQSWALIHYLLIGRPDRKPGQLRAYVAALSGDRDPVAVFNEVFGTAMDQMNRELQAYVKRGVWTAVNLRVPPELEKLPDIEPDRLLESEAEALQGHLLYQMRVPDRARVGGTEYRPDCAWPRRPGGRGHTEGTTDLAWRLLAP